MPFPSPVTYLYSDTATGVVDTGKLFDEVAAKNATGEITAIVQSVTADGTNIYIYFDVDLPDAEKPTLDAVVAAHDGTYVAPPELDIDQDGRQVVRAAISKKGWKLYYAGISFVIAQPNSARWYKYDFTTNQRVDRGWASVRLYDATGADITSTVASDPTQEVNVVVTELRVQPPFDLELVGGMLDLPAAIPAGEWTVWAISAPNIPAAYGGQHPFVEGMRIDGFYDAGRISLDGRTPKYLRSADLNPPNGRYENELSIIVQHPSGLNPSANSADVVEFQLVLDMYVASVPA